MYAEHDEEGKLSWNGWMIKREDIVLCYKYVSLTSVPQKLLGKKLCNVK